MTKCFLCGTIGENHKGRLKMGIEEEREKVIKEICEKYDTRKYTQKQLAEEMGMSVSDIRKSLKASNYEHTKKKNIENPNNLNPGQTVNGIIDFNEMKFLDKNIKKENK